MDDRDLGRRDFLETTARFLGWAMVVPLNTALTACERVEGSAKIAQSTQRVAWRPPVVSPHDLTLVARPARLSHDGVESNIWTFGDGPIGPTIETRRGDRARILLENQLPEPTIVHWHGFRPPEEVDGHPRLAVGPGRNYRYDFEIDEPAGLYWYHPHPHHRTGAQSYLGLAGLILVRDDVEDRLGLPRGDREIPLLLQDKQLDRDGRIVYTPRGHDMMEGYLGSVPFVNGVPSPTIEVEPAVHRIRIVSAANARIYRLGMSDRKPLLLIGGDVGFLPEPDEVPFADIGTAERLDLLVDFSHLGEGDRVSLKSLPFANPAQMGMGMMGGRGGMAGMMGSSAPQGAEMDLVHFVVRGAARTAEHSALVLPAFERIPRSAATKERHFRFDSGMMAHSINGRGFAMDRVDEEVDLGTTEVWHFVNDSPFPHSVHLHATHFQILSRQGGRDTVMPWETGWKDTVLVMPRERVEVIARFDRHPGIYLLHCHNLEHEDMDMMMNFRLG